MTPIVKRLSERAVPFEVIDHDRTYTAIEEARAIGIDADEVLKVVVIDSIDGFRLAVIPASRRLDMHLVREALYDQGAGLATENEIEWRWPAYQPGTLPPLGSLLDVPMYVDPELLGHDTVVFAAGEQTRSVKMRTKDLFRHEIFVVAPLTIPEEGTLHEGSARVPVGVSG
jgi:Ala-tRNA(Pro) deacylase